MFEDQDKLKKIARDAERARIIKKTAIMDKWINDINRQKREMIDNFGRCGAFVRDVGSSWVGCVRIQGHDGDHSEYDGPR